MFNCATNSIFGMIWNKYLADQFSQFLETLNKYIADIELAATFTLQKLLLIYKRERSVCCDDDLQW